MECAEHLNRACPATEGEGEAVGGVGGVCAAFLVALCEEGQGVVVLVLVRGVTRIIFFSFKAVLGRLAAIPWQQRFRGDSGRHPPATVVLFRTLRASFWVHHAPVCPCNVL